jgi:hypothetical protein
MIKQYRKKPIVIEAVQYTGLPGAASDIIHWILSNKFTARYHDDNTIVIDTLEGSMTVQPYDFVIKGVKGEFYPCKSDIFETTYEVVTND